MNALTSLIKVSVGTVEVVQKLYDSFLEFSRYLQYVPKYNCKDSKSHSVFFLFSLYSSALNLILLILFVSLTAGFILLPSLFSYITVNISNSIKIIHRIGIYNKFKKRSFLLNELIFQKITNNYLEKIKKKKIFLLNEQLFSKRFLKKN